ncbi:MAG TPA: class I SAM-dependent methyltransferase [Gaiellaceae bacterium]|jgi:2-polyprenyl-3-methyl-5-hydroxy-6-metoxy-1,4-benzoquinol methylase
MALRADVLDRHKQEWEELAKVDPLWAICTSADRLGGGWELAEFFDTGEAEISEMLKVADDLGEPVRRERALDFGCGVGRLSRPLAERFRECVGIDISEGMVKLARELNDDRPSCRFLVNAAPDLGQLETESFDLVYSALVLQHMPSVEMVESYVSEFLRVLRPGGLAVFQTLSHIPLALRLQPRRRVYAFLRGLGLSEQLLMMKMKLTPARGLAVPESKMRAIVERHGGTVELAEAFGERAAVEHVSSVRYFARAA